MMPPLRDRQSFRHEAFLWRDRRELVDGLVPFVCDGLDAGEAVAVALTAEHTGWVAAELGPRMAQVQVVDLVGLGANPARMMPLLLEFLDRWCGPYRPARAASEPIWVGRDRDEVAECELHEALVNLAVDPDLPFWLACAYDAARLPGEVLVESERSHPIAVTASSFEGSRSYRGYEHAQDLFSAELPARGVPSVEVRVTTNNSFAGIEQVTLRAASSGLASDRVVSLTDLVRRLALDSVRRGADGVAIRLWDDPGALTCELSAPVMIGDFLVGRRASTRSDPGTFWVANHACDLVQVRSGSAGTTYRLMMRK